MYDLADCMEGIPGWQRSPEEMGGKPSLTLDSNMFNLVIVALEIRPYSDWERGHTRTGNEVILGLGMRSYSDWE